MLEKIAIDITRTVVDLQNNQRQLFLTLIKKQFSHQLLISNKWQSMVVSLTHER